MTHNQKVFYICLYWAANLLALYACLYYTALMFRHKREENRRLADLKRRSLFLPETRFYTLP